MLLLCSTLFSQRVIERPQFGISTTGDLELGKIILSETSTVLSFKTSGSPGQWMSIPKKTYIQEVGSDEKVFIEKTEGIPLGKKYFVPDSGVVHYDLIFPPIDPECLFIDYGEDNDGGNWFIYNIEINTPKTDTPIPEYFTDVWFAGSGSQEFILALYNTVAIYKGKVWSYKEMNENGNKLEISIEKSGVEKILVLESVNENTCYLETGNGKRMKLYDWPEKDPLYTSAVSKRYEEPLFNQAEATFAGYIHNFTTRAGQSTGMIYVNNIFTGKQESHLLEIDDNGFFSVDIPMLYPQTVFVRCPFLEHSVFLEPGKRVFKLVDMHSSYNGQLFQGDLASLNTGLSKLQDLNFFNYQKIRNSVLDMNPDEYKTYCKSVSEKEYAELEHICTEEYIPASAYQVKKKELFYSNLERLTGYEMNQRSAIYKKNKESGSRVRPDVDVQESYYDFLNNEVVNDPLAVITSNYNSFLNRLKYSKILREKSPDKNKHPLLTLKETGRADFSEDEMKIITAIEEQTEFYNEITKLDSAYSSILAELSKENHELFKELSSDESFVFFYDAKDSLISRGIELNSDEEEMFNEIKQHFSRSELFNIQKNQPDPEEIKNLYSKYRNELKPYYKHKNMQFVKKTMKELWGINDGLVTDVFTSQDYCRDIVSDYTPIDNQTISMLKNEINSSFINDYIVYVNEQIKEEIERNKANGNENIHEAPDVDTEKLFEGIMEQFKGKVVYVDFWATWCSPCRSGIARIKPLKMQMKDEDIVFLYITNESSPENTWKNVIADVDGEHYRLSTDEYNVLAARFGISGIPHYVLVDKNGEVVRNNNLPHNNNSLADLFEEYLKK